MGSRPITAIINRSDFSISRPTVQKYMREMGISAIYPKPNLSKKNPEHKIFPYLLRGVKANSPNHVWGTDITFIRMKKGWLYLVAFLDWFSRYVLSWELDFTLEVCLEIQALAFGNFQNLQNGVSPPPIYLPKTVCPISDGIDIYKYLTNEHLMGTIPQ